MTANTKPASETLEENDLEKVIGVEEKAKASRIRGVNGVQGIEAWREIGWLENNYLQRMTIEMSNLSPGALSAGAAREEECYNRQGEVER